MSKDGRDGKERLRGTHSPLPAGWAWASVEDLLLEPTCNGISVKGSDSPPGEPALRLSAMTDRGFDYAQRRYLPISPGVAEELAVRDGDLYVSRGNGSLHLLGRPTLAQEPPERIVFPDTMIRLRFGGGPTLARYINFVWMSRVVRSQIESRARTTAGIYKISQPDVRAFRVPVPPSEEQSRIVQKIEEVFTELDAGVAALERVRAKLKRYRASVLKEAVVGGLTAAWRGDHPDVEPATDLLRRILDERRRRWEEAQLAKFAEAGKEPPKNWRGKYTEPEGPDTSALSPLPPGWCWAGVDQLLIEPTCNGISVKGSDTLPGIASLRLSAMSDEGFDYSKRRYLPIDNLTVEQLAVRRGDFFVSRGNGSLHLVGRGTLAQEPAEVVVFPDTMIRLRICEVEPLRKFLNLIWASRTLRRQIENRARTTAGIYKISQRDVETFFVPLPPSNEQAEIVREIERRFSVVDEIDTQVEANLKRASRLRQCILKRAFEGRLVLQDPDDEPAGRLLERIRRERDEQRAPAGKSSVGRKGRHRDDPMPLLKEEGPGPHER